MSNTLWQITDELAHLYDMLLAAEESGEVSEELCFALDNTEAELDRKAEGYASVVRKLMAVGTMYQLQAKAFQQAAAQQFNAADRLRNRILDAMQLLDAKKIGPFTRCKNGGLQPLDVHGPVPDEFTRPVPDNDKIRQALERGQELNFALLAERGEHIRLKP